MPQCSRVQQSWIGDVRDSKCIECQDSKIEHVHDQQLSLAIVVIFSMGSGDIDEDANFANNRNDRKNDTVDFECLSVSC